MTKDTYIFGFGKHDGKVFDTIIIEDPSYLIWLYKQDWVKEKKLDLYKIIEENLKEITESANYEQMEQDCPACGTPADLGCNCMYDILN